MYDLIGDIHGFATELKRLLSKMGYREIDGVWQHPKRRVVFLGDFVDRGPEQIEVVDIVRAMVTQGHALTVMGNHEFNAVAWGTPDQRQHGEFLRPHTEKNYRQHKAFLEQVGEGSQKHRGILDWFSTLPLYLDLEGFRVVHACWHPHYLAAIKPFTDQDNRILPSAWSQLTQKDTLGYEAIETLLKGLEVSLPAGYEFLDKDNHPRTNVRTRWWALDGVTYRDLAMVPAEAINDIPHEPIPEDVLPGYDGEKPVFIGHYWLKGVPEPLRDHIACLDYSVVDPNGGKLCAYRWQAGEQRLSSDHFVWVER